MRADRYTYGEKDRYYEAEGRFSSIFERVCERYAYRLPFGRLEENIKKKVGWEVGKI